MVVDVVVDVVAGMVVDIVEVAVEMWVMEGSSLCWSCASAAKPSYRLGAIFDDRGPWHHRLGLELVNVVLAGFQEGGVVFQAGFQDAGYRIDSPKGRSSRQRGRRADCSHGLGSSCITYCRGYPATTH